MINDLPKCKTCKWRGTDKDPRVCGNYKKINDDFCNISEEDSDKDDLLLYSYDEGGHFIVGDNFGCIHHEEKEKEINEGDFIMFGQKIARVVAVGENFIEVPGPSSWRKELCRKIQNPNKPLTEIYEMMK